MIKNRLNSVIIGATGYVGLDLVNILSKHPNIKIKHLCSQKNLGKRINSFDNRIKKKLPKLSNINKVDWKNLDIVFLSLPNGEAQKLINKLFFKYKNLKFIDLSADFRITDLNLYKKYYGKKHFANKLIKKSLYSITELSLTKLKKFRIIANPGCYPTSIQIPLIPLLKKKMIEPYNIIIDSKSGYSGAGKKYKLKFSYKNFELSTYGYAANKHRHEAELDQELKKINKNIKFIFNPHLIPTFRGILSSIYLVKKNNSSIDLIINELKKTYKKSSFVKIKKKNSPLGTGDVIHTNNCEISVCQSKEKNKIIIFSAIDNLIKGAAGQAVQNMNVMYGLKESKGIK